MADNFMDSYKDDPLEGEMAQMEPEAPDWRDILPEDAPEPMRVALFFTGVTTHQEGEDLEENIESVIKAAEVLGLNYEWGATSPMDLNNVVDGSALQQQITGGI